MKRFLCFSLIVLILMPLTSLQAQDCISLRLEIGGRGRVLPGDANNLRDQPSAEGNRIGQIPGGAEFTVLDGPVCDSQGRAWWQVNYDGLIGWTVGGQGSDYYVEPVSAEGETEPELTPVEPTVVDCSGIPPRLTVGRQGRVLEGEPLLVVSSSSRAMNINGEIPAGGIFTVIDEPECDSNRRLWWKVSYEDIEGWIREGVAGTYFVEPVLNTGETLVMPPRFSCPDGLPARLVSGGLGQVVPGGANRIRSAPSSDGEILGVLPSEAVFSVGDEMRCDDSGTLWRSIEYNSIIGWTAEVVGDSYTVEPSGGGGIVPDEREVITLENLWQVTELARFLPALSRSDNDGFNYGIGVSWSPDSTRVAVTDAAGVVVYDMRDLAEPPRRFHSNMMVQGSIMFNAVFSPDGNLLAAGSADGIAYVWDVESGEQITALQHQDDHYVSTVAFSPDGNWLATGSVYSIPHLSENNNVILWDAATFEQIRTLPGFENSFVHDRLTFSPDSQQLIKNGSLIDLSTGEEIRSFNGSPAVFSADGSMIFAGQYLYEEGTTVRSIPLNIVNDADFHPSGAMFLTASIEVGGPYVDDRGLRVWDGKLGTPILTMSQNQTEAAAFSSDGTLMAVLTFGRLYLYGIP